MDMNVYTYQDYRRALADAFKQRKARDARVTLESFGNSIGVQKTFVSKVFNGRAHLSDDHLFMAIQYFGFNEEAAKYLRLLFDYTRSGLHVRKKELLREIRRIQEEQRQFRKHTTSEVVVPEKSGLMSEYYLDPMNLVVHAHFGLKKFCEQPGLLMSALGLSQSHFHRVMDCLIRHDVIAQSPKTGHVTVKMDRVHLDIRSVFAGPAQTLFRLVSNQHIHEIPPGDRFIFSLTLSGNSDLKAKIQELFLKLIEQVERESERDEVDHNQVYQINFDLFPWTKE